MDALPIQETPGRSYGSGIAGRMHACGHDGHMAMLLGAATLLSALRERLDRDVVFCFQPGEEGFGGAER
jgi:hippurate hydrolase